MKRDFIEKRAGDAEIFATPWKNFRKLFMAVIYKCSQKATVFVPDTAYQHLWVGCDLTRKQAISLEWPVRK